jgi:thymidylate synthase
MNHLGNGPRFSTIDAVQRWVFERLLDAGVAVAPRGLQTRELIGQSFVLTDPRSRVVVSPSRRWSFPLAIGEFCWHASASNEIDALSYYAPRWRAFSVDGRTVRGSCYGRHIFSREGGNPSRWEAVLALLRDDPASRRAVIDLSDQEVLDPLTADVSCTSTFQVLIRDAALHVIVHMRSNDAVWGLPYDIFLFTMLQEMMSAMLGLEPGVYIHSVGSLHLYERHFDLANRVLEEPDPAPMKMARMGPLSEFGAFLAAERDIRAGLGHAGLSPYWTDLATTLEDFARRRRTQIDPYGRP